MLHTQTIQRETFELLTKLMQDPMMQGFNLAGGTALEKKKKRQSRN